MHKGAIAIAAVLAACGGEGVDLEITSEVEIDRVELFVGTAHCYDDDGELCVDGVAWSPTQRRPPGYVYFMKGDENIIYTTRFEGSRAVMHLQAQPSHADAKVLAIVGFLADKPVAVAKMWDVRIPAHAAETWQVTLEKADPADEHVTAPPGETSTRYRVHTWKRERVANSDELSRCVVIQHWKEDKKVWEGDFIVPESDPDCDGHAIECDDRFSNLNADTARAYCLAESTDASLTSPCVLGTMACADGTSDDRTCSEPDQAKLCVPEQLCEKCSELGPLDSCLTASIHRDSPVGHVECELAPDALTAGPCLDGPGAVAHMTLPVACQSVEIRPLDDPFVASNEPTKAVIDQAQVAVVWAAASDLCTIEIKWQAGTAEVGRREWFMLVVHVASGHSIAVPVEIGFGDTVDCGGIFGTVECSQSTDLALDSMFSCAATE